MNRNPERCEETHVSQAIRWPRVGSIAGALVAGTLGLGANCRQTAQDIVADRQAGRAQLLLCGDPNEGTCHAINELDLSQETVKLDVSELQAQLGTKPLRSLQLSCGRPTSLVLWEQCNFQGRMAAYQCTPTASNPIAVLDVPLAPWGAAGSIALGEGGRSGVDQLAHTAIPLWKPSSTGDTPAKELGDRINDVLKGVSATMNGPPDPSLVSLIPQCASSSSSSSSSGGSSHVVSAQTRFTRIFWADDLNIGQEVPRQGVDPGDRLSRSSCVTRSDSFFVRGNVLALHHVAVIRLDVAGAEYVVGLYWYFRPTVQQTSSGRKVVLEPVHASYYLPPGQNLVDIVPVLQGMVQGGLAGIVPGSGNQVACALLTAIKNGADALVSGGGEAVLSNRNRITFTVDSVPPDGGVPCNTLAGVGCPDYESVPPTLVLHQDSP